MIDHFFQAKPPKIGGTPCDARRKAGQLQWKTAAAAGAAGGWTPHSSRSASSSDQIIDRNELIVILNAGAIFNNVL